MTALRLRKYPLPRFLEKSIAQSTYDAWLHRRAAAHVKRDCNVRKNAMATVRSYKQAIHRAVVESEGRDAYTGERLDWDLIGTYDNEVSKRDRRAYKKIRALLPTVDHVGDGTGAADFRICSLRTNDAKNDLPLLEFVSLCERVVKHANACRGGASEARTVEAGE